MWKESSSEPAAQIALQHSPEGCVLNACHFPALLWLDIGIVEWVTGEALTEFCACKMGQDTERARLSGASPWSPVLRVLNKPPFAGVIR